MKAITVNNFICAALALGMLTAFVAIGQEPDNRIHRIVPIRPMTSGVEVLHGDPDKAGAPFVIRIRELAGGIIPPHRHDVDEHITVAHGTLFFAVGENFDRAHLKEMKAGSYAFIPKGSVMFGYTPDAAIVQVHGIGPFNIHWRSTNGWHQGLKTLDSPDAAGIFKFKRGELVVTPRGTGRVRQGYDSGEVIGYEIDGPDGALFMAEECEIEGSRSRNLANSIDRGCFSGGQSGASSKGKHRRH